MKTDQELWHVCKPQLVPAISDEDLEQMIGQIKPLACVEDHRWREIDITGVDRRRVAFTWEPKLGRPVRQYLGGLNTVSIVTFHTWAYYGFLKPTLAEVYACIRQFVPDYSAVRFFWLNSQDMDRRNIIGDYHWCPCILFGEEMSSVIDQDWPAFVQRCSVSEGKKA